jgi:magnesium transporter
VSVELEQTLWDQLREAARDEDARGLTELLSSLDEPDRIHALSHLDAEDLGKVLAVLDPEDAAELVERIPELHALEAVRQLAPADAAFILEALPSDERADLVAGLDSAEADAILAEAEPETAEAVTRLLQYPSDSAGGLMVTEFVAVPAAHTAQEVIEHLRANVERYADFMIQYVYALGDRRELVGVVPLRNLLLARRERRIASLMLPDPIAVDAMAPLSQLSELFDEHHFLGIPVVDEARRLAGVLQREDVDEALVDRAQANELKSRGIVVDELRTMPLLTRSRRRLSWLSINIVLNVAAASVIALYEETLSAAIALVVFLPIISDMSGCSGNQAVAVSLRELTLGVIRPTELLRVWWKEASLGCVNGIVLGCLIGFVAWAWKGNIALGAVVGLALAINTFIAVSIGGLVPLALRRFGFDPALASGPILTTATDICGFFLVLSFATLALGWLVET